MIPHQYTRRLKPVSIKRNKVKSDPQRHLVYQMEREYAGTAINTSMSVYHLQEVADHACYKWKVSPVSVDVRALEKPDHKTYGMCTGNIIVLNKAYHGDNLSTLLHELAHWITHQLYPDAYDHGPEFCDVYADLLDQYKVLPRACFIVLAAKHGVEVNEGSHDG